MERKIREDLLDLVKDLYAVAHFSADIENYDINKIAEYNRFMRGEQYGKTLEAFGIENRENLFAIPDTLRREVYIKELLGEFLEYTPPLENAKDVFPKIQEKGGYDYLDESEKYILNCYDLIQTVNYQVQFLCSQYKIDFLQITNSPTLAFDTELFHIDSIFLEDRKKELEKQSEIELENQTKEKLTHKQQILLLHAIGFFEIPKIKTGLNTQQKGILLAYLLNKSEKNSEDYLRGIEGELKEKDPKNCKTPKNIKTINEVLRKVRLKEYKVK